MTDVTTGASGPPDPPDRPGPPDRPDPDGLRQLAEQVGIDADEIRQAEAAGHLDLLYLEHEVFPHPGRYTEAEIEQQIGLGADANALWRALGFPSPDPDDRAFTDADLAILQVVDRLISGGTIRRESAIQLARVIGSSMQRVAEAQLDALDARRASGDPLAHDDQVIEVRRAQAVTPMLPEVLEYAWRRHLQSAARRRLATEQPGDEGPAARVIGFADLVGFTSLAQELDDHELSDVVDRFEAVALDIVSGHGGRVVKMIGDEVMFEVAEPVAGAEIALDLSDAFQRDDSINDIRVGIAYGPALARDGDLFGPTVNLAARMVSIAFAGAVVTSTELRAALADDDRYTFKSMRNRQLKHIGRVQLFAIRRSSDTTEGIAERARRRRSQFRERVNQLVERSAEPTDDVR